MERCLTVSIIIPVYNEETNLPSCLGSLGEVDWPAQSVQIIVVDNGSTDKTREIARSMGAMVLCDPGATVAGLRNLGACHAHGKILAFVDADCTVPRDWLVSASRYFDTDGIAAWGNPPEVPPDATWVQRAWYLLRRKSKEVEAVDWLESMNLFVRKETFERVQGFDASLETCEDVDLCYRLAEHGAILADGSIRMVHLGEAKTLTQFARKEFWRGRDNLRGVFSHGFSLKELPSLAIPVYFGLFMPVLYILALAYGTGLWLLPAVLATVAPGWAVLMKIRGKKASIFLRLQLVLLSYVYFLVRTLAVVRPKKLV